jgi:5-formyltetrahydrofolate cyclo-ligase
VHRDYESDADVELNVQEAKAGLRAACWAAIRSAGAARFPGVEGRIPNFVGAEAAAASLSVHPLFVGASVLKINPDSPQRPVRHAALKAGKTLVFPVPRLRDAAPFLLVEPDRLDAGQLWHASSAKGAMELGRPVQASGVPSLDLIVTGCVGVTRGGARLGKGGGYSDLEFAMLRELGRVSEHTPIVTTVHSCQVLADGAIPMLNNDISLDLIVTEAEVIACPRQFRRPTGVLSDRLSAEKAAEIPALSDR